MLLVALLFGLVVYRLHIQCFRTLTSAVRWKHIVETANVFVADCVTSTTRPMLSTFNM